MRPEVDFQKSSLLGSILMAVVGLATFFVSSWYLKHDWLTTFIITIALPAAFGFIYNYIAKLRGTRRIHWLDFAFNLLPWDF